MRAGDADREATIESLRDHAASGRLDEDELDERLEVALRATTFGELRAQTFGWTESHTSAGWTAG